MLINNHLRKEKIYQGRNWQKKKLLGLCTKSGKKFSISFFDVHLCYVKNMTIGKKICGLCADLPTNVKLICENW